MEQIQQVLYNLLDNAIKFSNDNSSINIETSVKNDKVFRFCEGSRSRNPLRTACPRCGTDFTRQIPPAEKTGKVQDLGFLL